jgi:hypothetical protein
MRGAAGLDASEARALQCPRAEFFPADESPDGCLFNRTGRVSVFFFINEAG